MAGTIPHASEEMALSIASEIVGPHIGDRSFVNIAALDA